MSEAAAAIGVSHETLRRWDRAGKLVTRRDPANCRRIPVSEVERLTQRSHPEVSARPGANRMEGVVRSVECAGVMAVVELDAGPFRVCAAVPGDAVRALALAPGVPAAATVNVTSVMIERDG